MVVQERSPIIMIIISFATFMQHYTEQLSFGGLAGRVWCSEQCSPSIAAKSTISFHSTTINMIIIIIGIAEHNQKHTILMDNDGEWVEK